MDREKRHAVNCPFNNCYYYEEEIEEVGGVEHKSTFCCYPYDDFVNEPLGRDCPHYKPDFSKIYRKRNR